jgi:uncharacterized membrane protein YdjX (TVP38/TMEM64 family)
MKAAAILSLLLVAAILVLAGEGMGPISSDAISHELQRVGPLAIISLRAVAALLAVVPSSPVVLASGATQGVLWGTVYVLLGALTGSVLAFQIGRCLGRSVFEKQRWAGKLRRRRYSKWLLEENASQTRLMSAVLFCRLIPGLNLDGLSYIAGATALTTWRFCLATLAGLLPYTVMLVAAGRGLVELSAAGRASWLIFALLILLAFAGLIACTKLPGLFSARRTSGNLAPFNWFLVKHGFYDGDLPMSDAKTTTDHEEIRAWAEKRGGSPASVRDTGGRDAPGVLRLDFDPADEDLEPISWDEFFQKFDDEKLAFLFQDRTADGSLSRFHKFINRAER